MRTNVTIKSTLIQTDTDLCTEQTENRSTELIENVLWNYSTVNLQHSS
jgi:hypothetical protein